MRIPALFLCSAVALASQDKKWRERLTSLLHEIDNKDSVDQLGKYISVDEVGSLLERAHSKHKVTSSPRRRGGHPPCECPDNPGDANSVSCIDRRYGALQGAVSAATTPSTTFGFSSDTGRNQLRYAFHMLVNSSNVQHNQVLIVQKNMSDFTSGRLPVADRLTQRILNEEALMAQSVNAAWMNLVNVTLQTVNAGNQVQGAMANATQNMLNWFSQMQATQDSLSYTNMVKTVDYARKDLSTYVNQINAAINEVYNVLNALDKNMGGSESSSSSLSDSLNSAADQLLNKINQYNSSLAFAAQPFVDDARSALAQSINQLQTYMNGQISSLGTAAMSKQKTTRDSSTQQITSQYSASQQLVTAATSQTQQSLDAAQNQQNAFLNTTKVAYDSAANFIETFVQNNTNSLSSKVSGYRSNLSSATAATSSIQNLLAQFTNDEKSAVTKTNTDIGNAKAAANKALADGTAAATAKQSQTLTSATSVGQGAVSAVGTNFEANMNQMGMNSNQLMGSLSSSANDAAKQASAAQSSLAVSATQGTAAIQSASDSVSSQFQNAFKNILNSVGNIPGGISGTAASAGNMLAVIQASKTNMTAASDMIRQMFFGTQAGTMKNQSQAEAAIGNFLILLQQKGPQADDAVSGIGSTVQGSVSTASSTVALATTQNQQNSAAVSNTATQIAGTQTLFANQLSNIVNQMVTSGNQVNAGPLQGGLSQTISGVVGSVDQMRSQLDQAVAGQVDQGNNNANALASAQQGVQTAGASAQAQAQSSASAVNQTVTGALGSISSFLAGAESDASASTQAQINQIDALKKQSDIIVGQVSLAQMDQIRALAANIDSLMLQVNSFLGTNSQPLYNQIQGLGSSGQRLFMFMNTIQSQRNAIAQDATDQGPYSWDDILRAMLSTLRSNNATAFNSLDQVSSSFNSSASNLAANITAQLNDLAAQYANTASSLQTQLNAVQGSAMQSLSTSNATNLMINQIQGIQSNLSSLASNATAIISSTSNNVSLVSAANMQAAYSTVASASSAAANDAAYASSILAQVQANATQQANLAQQIVQQNPVPVGDVQRAGSLSLLNASMAQSQLAAQRAAIDKLNADSGNIAGDYAAEIQAQQQARLGQSSLMYDRVVAAKGHASSMVGQIAQKMAQDRASRAANVSMSQADQSIQIGLLRHGMSSLVTTFDQFVQIVNQSFKSSQNDRDGFVAALLGALRNKLTQLDNSVYQQDQAMVQSLVELGGSLDSYQNDPFDQDLNNFVSQLQSWSLSELKAIQDQDASIPTVVNDKTLEIPSGLNTTINAAVVSIAQTAQNVLRKNGIPIPSSLTDYVTTYR